METETNTDTIVIIIVIVICSCILFIVSSLLIYIRTSTTTSSNSVKNASSNVVKNAATNAVKNAVTNDATNASKNSSTLNTTKVKGKATELDCYVDYKAQVYTCTIPSDKKIYIKSGPLFKISSSIEKDSFGKISYDYYIIGSTTFLSDNIISVANKEIEINTIEDLLKFFNDMETNFNTENTIPDKCLNVSTKIREESGKPYNTMCTFFPGLNKIDSIASILEKALLPLISDKILNDYYNKIDGLINKQNPELTVLEYTMYLALLNKIKKSNFKYFTLCTSDNDNVNC
jgi:hypothetical protein